MFSSHCQVVAGMFIPGIILWLFSGYIQRLINTPKVWNPMRTQWCLRHHVDLDEKGVLFP